MKLSLVVYGSVEYDEMIILRNRILRQPLGLSFTYEELVRESNDIFMACFEESKIVACCIFTQNEDAMKLRQMAVSSERQRNGIGSLLIQFSEKIAQEYQFHKIVLHARIEAVSFYVMHGYCTKGNQFFEVGIPHIEMYKLL